MLYKTIVHERHIIIIIYRTLFLSFVMYLAIFQILKYCSSFINFSINTPFIDIITKIHISIFDLPQISPRCTCKLGCLLSLNRGCRLTSRSLQINYSLSIMKIRKQKFFIQFSPFYTQALYQ